MKFYGFIPPNHNASVVILDVQLKPNDILLPYKKKLYDLAYLKIPRQLNTYGIRVDTPMSAGEVQRATTLFRLRTYSYGHKYIELVRPVPSLTTS